MRKTVASKNLRHGRDRSLGIVHAQDRFARDICCGIVSNTRVFYSESKEAEICRYYFAVRAGLFVPDLLGGAPPPYVHCYRKQRSHSVQPRGCVCSCIATATTTAILGQRGTHA